MKIESLAIADVKLITPLKFGDERGFFSETWKERALSDAGVSVHFVQDNHVFSAAKNTVRGLHFQIEPMAQGKLIRVTRGAVLDVVVDVRHSSPTFGRHVTAVLSSANWAQLWVPKGFAHGYCTLEPDTEVIYKVTQYYSPQYDKGILWDDPALSIPWPVTREKAHLSDKDKMQPTLASAMHLMKA